MKKEYIQPVVESFTVADNYLLGQSDEPDYVYLDLDLETEEEGVAD